MFFTILPHSVSVEHSLTLFFLHHEKVQELVFNCSSLQLLFFSPHFSFSSVD